MIIHDMRNPTVSMKMNSNLTLIHLQCIFGVLNDFKDFEVLCDQVL